MLVSATFWIPAFAGMTGQRSGIRKNIMATVEFRQETSRRLIIQAEAGLRSGDLAQACEKASGAATHSVKSIAERRGWEHDSQAALFRVVDNIVRLSGDREIRTLFSSANGLYWNFHEGWLYADYIADSMEDVKRLLAKLDAFARDEVNGAAPLDGDVNGAGV